jgi:hypothetical protein
MASTEIPMMPSVKTNTMNNGRSFSIEVHPCQKALSKRECGPAIYKAEEAFIDESSPLNAALTPDNYLLIARSRRAPGFWPIEQSHAGPSVGTIATAAAAAA